MSTAARSACAGRLRRNERYHLLELPDDLYGALLATLPPREDRDLEAPLFSELTDARLRMAITRACRVTGTPHFSPHGLRRRRGSLHCKRTGSLAEVAELLGHSKRVAAITTSTRSPTTARLTARSRWPESVPKGLEVARRVGTPVGTLALGIGRFAGGSIPSAPTLSRRRRSRKGRDNRLPVLFGFHSERPAGCGVASRSARRS